MQDEKPHMMRRCLRRSCVGVAAACILLAGACAEDPDSQAARTAYQTARTLARAGRLQPAVVELAVALEHDPHHLEAQLLRGAVLERLNRLDEAEGAYLEAQRLSPEHPDPALHLARVARLRDLDARIEAARRALAAATERGAAHRALADLFLARRHARPAQHHYARALRHDPSDAGAHSGLSVALVGIRRHAQGLYHASEALRLRPDDVRALGELVWVLATSSDETLRAPEEAIRWAEEAEQKTPRVLDGLAAAYAAVGRHDDAVATARAAIGAASDEQDHALAHEIRARLSGYEAGRAFTGPPIDPG
jgi:Flp pilus assembly protein TadD